MHIDKKYFRSDTVYKNIGTNHQEGQIGWNFLQCLGQKLIKQ